MSLVLCRLEDLGDPGARGFVVDYDDGSRRQIVVVRRAGALFGYVNACPHQGTALDALPDRFLTRDGAQLICGSHGARFRIEDGECVAGPCRGERLARFAIELVGGEVRIAPEAVS